MYDEAREFRFDPGIITARKRVVSILEQQRAASIRTLEAKIAESGRGDKPPPHLISNAVRQLRSVDQNAPDGTLPVIMMEKRPGWPCEMYYLSAADPDAVARALEVKAALEIRWHRYARRTGPDSIGALGETIVRRAFEDDAHFFVAPGWGNVTYVNGKYIPANPGPVGSVDGLVFLANLPPDQGSAIVEVKNQREWIYPRDPDLWDIVRNGFAVNAVPIIFARKIYPSAFIYVLRRLGGIGIQMHAQFVPASASRDLEMCKHRLGLGFKDLNFDETVPKSLEKAIPIIASQIAASRRRMEAVRDLAEPHLDVLASDQDRTARRQSYAELQVALDARFGRGN